MSYRLEYPRGGEIADKKAAWQHFWQQRLSFQPRVHAMRKRGEIYRPDAVQAVNEACNKLLIGVRRYLLTVPSANIAAFERDVAIALSGFEKKLDAAYSTDDVLVIVSTMLAGALQSVEVGEITEKPLFQNRLQLSNLVFAMQHLSEARNTLDEKPESPLSAPPVVVLSKTGYRGERWYLAEEPLSPAIAPLFSGTRTRVALATVLLGLGVVHYAGSSSSHDPLPAEQLVRMPSFSENSHARPISSPVSSGSGFVRHTGLIVQPSPPHHSVVLPTVRNFWSTYATDMQRCFDSSGSSVHNLEQLVTTIANDQAAHRLFEAISARNDQHFTIWWTCEEVVIAPGVQTKMNDYISPRPVTVRLTH